MSLQGAAVPPPAGGADDGADDALINFHNPNRWFFDKSRLENTPSRRAGIDADKELSYRQQSANFIQDIGQRLQVNQLCINTAIVYMHRFYMYHSFTQFHRNSISTASIFLAAKVEEQPRKLDHFIKVSHYCLHRGQPAIDPKSEAYQEQSAELVMNENVLLQTLGFDVAIDHPHTHVVKCCQLVRASKDLAQTSYFMATNSLHLTTMCLQYRPTVVACVCIHLACKWSSWEIPRSKEGKDWWMYVDDTVTADQLETLTTEFLAIFNKSPSRLKRKIISLNQTPGGGMSNLLNVPGLAGLTADSTTANNSQAVPRSRSRSPSPKRQKLGKPGEMHGSMPPPKGHPSLLPPPGHHPLKPSSVPGPHGIMQHPPNKVGHSGSMKPPHMNKPPHPPPPNVAKDHHQYKDHPPYQPQQQHGKIPPFPAHGHHSSQGPYPHGGPARPSLPAQLHHSHSSQGHSQVGPKVPGRSSSTGGGGGGHLAAAGFSSSTVPVKPVLRTASLFSPEFQAESPAPVALKSEPPPSSVVPFHSPVAAFSEPSSIDGNQSGGSAPAAAVLPSKVEAFDFEDISLSSSILLDNNDEDEDDESHKHKKKKKEKHKHKDKDKEKHKEEKKHKKDKHKEKSKHKDKHKDKARTSSPSTPPVSNVESDPPRQNLKIKLSLNTGQR